MPQIVHQAEIRLQWEDLDNWVHRPPQKLHRPKGLHLSGIIKVALVDRNLLTPEDTEDEMPLSIALGLAWENWVVGLWPEMEWQPGTQSYKRGDGKRVYGSPDGRKSKMLICVDCGIPASKPVIEYDLDCPCGGAIGEYAIIEEFKSTKKSIRTHQMDTEYGWLWQGAGYCLMAGLEFVRYHVHWINGNYRPPKAIYNTYLVRFEPSYLKRYEKEILLGYWDKAVPE